MDAKHTPGPWEVEASIYEHMAAEIIADRGLAQVWAHENAMADAHLIAASPELFAAGCSVLDYATLPEILADPKRHENDVFAIRLGDLRALSAAIAKAEGRT